MRGPLDAARQLRLGLFHQVEEHAPPPPPELLGGLVRGQLLRHAVLQKRHSGVDQLFQPLFDLTLNFLTNSAEQAASGGAGEADHSLEAALDLDQLLDPPLTEKLEPAVDPLQENIIIHACILPVMNRLGAALAVLTFTGMVTAIIIRWPRPQPLVRAGFSLTIPAGWHVLTKDEDYQPDHKIQL